MSIIDIIAAMEEEDTLPTKVTRTRYHGTSAKGWGRLGGRTPKAKA